MGEKVGIPIMVRCDNVRAIFMAENSSYGVRIQHTDMRYHFVCEHVEDGFIKIIFVKSDDNIAHFAPFAMTTWKLIVKVDGIKTAFYTEI
jgi:hypothetical protein